MRRVRPRRDRGRLLRHVRRQRVRYIAILPSLVTILNGVFGFTAIVLTSKADGGTIGNLSYYAAAAYIILLAMIADMLDGRLARMSQSTSSFGGQLDSLCDMVSFGIAPAFLMLRLVESRLDLTEVLSGGLLHRFIWLAALTYISCAAIRLARFNVENEENEATHMSFMGLPSPAAAGVVISLVIFHQEQFRGVNLLIYALPFLTLGLAILMVSRIRYPHVVNVYLRGKKPFGYLIRFLLFLGLVAWNMQIALVLIFGVFAGGSFTKWLYQKVLRHRSRRRVPHAEAAEIAPTQKIPD
jgi:CDP-diacylglycerol--serine O-phosphatidyltransferase